MPGYFDPVFATAVLSLDPGSLGLAVWKKVRPIILDLVFIGDFGPVTIPLGSLLLPNAKGVILRVSMFTTYMDNPGDRFWGTIDASGGQASIPWYIPGVRVVDVFGDQENNQSLMVIPFNGPNPNITYQVRVSGAGSTEFRLIIEIVGQLL